MDELQSLRVLILNDIPSDAEAMLDELRRSGFKPEWWRVDNEPDYLAHLDPAPDVILADYSLIQWDAAHALLALQERSLEVPFIVVFGTIDEEIVVSVMKLGAADYLVKDRLARLGEAVEHALEVKKLSDERKRARDDISARAGLQKVMGELGMRAMQNGDLLALMNAAVASVASALEADYCSILEFQADGQTLLLRAGVGWNPGLVGQAASTMKPESLAAYLLRTQAPVLVQDFATETRFRMPDLLHEHGVVSGLSVLIRRRAQPIGMLGVFTAQQRNFTADHVYLLQGVAELLSTAIERSETEAALNASETRYRRLFEAAKDGILILDAETGIIDDVNPFLINLLGYSHAEFLGKKIWEIGLFKDVVASRDAFRRLTETGYVRYEDLPLQAKDGRHVAVEFVSNAYQAGGKTVIQCNIRDITDRRRAEEEIKSLAKFPGENPQPVLRLSDEGLVLYANEPGRSLLADLGGAVGEPAPALWHDLITNTLASPLGIKFDFPHRDKIWSFFAAPILGEAYINIYGTDITARRRAEVTLTREHTLLRTVIDNVPDFIYAKDVEGRFLLRNAPWLRLMGVSSADEVVGKTDFDFYPQELAEHYTADDQQVIASGQPLINHEEKTVDSDGNTRWILTTKVPLPDSAGNVTGLVGIGRDITAWKRAEDDLRFQAQLLNTVGQAVIATNLDNQVIYWNRFAETLYGWSAGEAQGRNIVDLTPADTSREQAAEIMAYLQSGESWSGEFIVQRKDGTTFPALVTDTPIVDEKGALIGVIGVSIDITERKQAEEAIWELNADLERRVVQGTAQYVNAKERTEAILNSSADAIILCRPDGTIDQANLVFDTMFGHHMDEVLNQPLTSLMIPQHAPLQERAISAVIGARQPQRLEVTIQQHDGSTFDADLMLSPVIRPDLTLAGIVCIIRDISERKRMEDDLREALTNEKALSELKTRFTSMVSHDIRTPLSIISASAEMLRDYYDRMDAETRTRHFERIGGQIERMVELLTDVLTINRDVAGEASFNPVSLDLDQYCRALVEEFRSSIAAKHVLLYASLDEGVQIQADETLLYQALTNLLQNALKYSPEGSTIRLDLTLDESDAILKIADSGIGIPKKDLLALFEPFHRASNVGAIEGTGLGLAIVKRSIEAHGGTITCESQVGVGTTFTIRIPRGAAEALPTTTP